MFKIFSKKPAFKLSGYIALALAILEAVRVVGFISYEPNYLILTGVMLIPVMQSLTGANVYFSKVYLLFCLYLCLNIIITNPLPVFKSWERLLFFILLMSSISPMISTDTQRYFRSRCFMIFMCLMSVLSSASCICYFLGINYFRNYYGITDYYSQAGLFGGLFAHSMLLAPMAGISACFMLWIYLRTKKKAFIILATLSLGALLFAASRSALLSTICACLTLILLFYKKKSAAIKYITAAAIALTLTFPLWESSLSGIIQKNESNEHLGKYGSRTVKFEARLTEFAKSPVFGVGFAAIDPNGIDDYNHWSGAIEPGSSWLCTMSMTGIIGFSFVLYIMVNAFLTAKSSKSELAPLMASIVMWFAIHMMFEGYIFAGGGALCFIYWLSIGVATDLKYHSKSLTS